MDRPVNRLPNRREVLAGGLLLSAALLVPGCQGRGRWKPLSRDQLDRPAAIPPEHRRRPFPGVGAPVAPVSGMIPRREWTDAGPIMSLANPMNGVRRITVHHDGMSVFTSRSRTDAAERLELIRRAHVGQRWADIGYHYIVDPAGRVWEGRPAHLQGAHVRFNNEHNLGVMVLGNFEDSRPAPEALEALDALVGVLMRRHAVPLDQVWTHRELAPTACPGRNLQSYMLATRSGSGRLARA
jgi:hypothetical protein